MRIAMVAAKFTGPEANELRRAMATFRRRGTIDTLHEKMVGRMTARGYPAEFAERCFNQIKGFGEYGFPESHAASFAHLVYVSAWIKCHYPAAFAAALLNAQPMGFYAPAQIVRDAREHGVEAREADVNLSHWDCTLEAALSSATSTGSARCASACARSTGCAKTTCSASSRYATPFPPISTRICLLRHRSTCPPPDGESGGDGRWPSPVSEITWPAVDCADRAPTLPTCRERRARFSDVRDLWRRSGLKRASLEKLAAADAFRSLGLDRRQALWEVRGLPKELPLPLFEHADAADAGGEPLVTLPIMPLSEHVVNDYRTLRLSLKAHPMSFLRDRIRARALRRLRRSQSHARRGAGERRRRGAGAPAPRLGARRRVHDHRGRDGDRQFGDLAQGARARAEGGDGRAPRRGAWPHPAPRGHHPCRRRAARGPQRLAAASSPRTARP